MVLDGIMVTFPEGTTVPDITKRLVPVYKTWVRDRDETRLKELHKIYMQYYRGDLDVLGFAVESFCTDEVFEELNNLLALKTPPEEYKAARHPSGEVTIYAEGRPQWLLQMAIALDFGPHLKMRENNVY